MIQPLRVLTFALVATLSLALSGCGVKEDVVLEGKTEGVYLDVGKLKYQVQISRQLNPYDSEDREYLTAVSPLERDLKPDETWFAVFVRVQNGNHDGPAQTVVTDFEIEDTRGNIFEPVPIGAVNGYAYNPPKQLAPRKVYPRPNSTAGFGPTKGSLLLFKLKIKTLALRPLELKIRPRTGPEGVVDVDI